MVRRMVVKMAVLMMLICGLAAFAGKANAGPRNSEATASALELMPLLAQSDDGSSGSSVRLRGRSIRGLISLGILGVAGIGWVLKKLTGSGSDD